MQQVAALATKRRPYVGVVAAQRFGHFDVAGKA
jgi:hypothetical protein